MATGRCHLLAILFFGLLYVTSCSFLLPIVKDNRKGQYFTSFLVGTPPNTRVFVALDFSNPWSWFTCDIYGYNRSSTFHPVDCESTKCQDYGGDGCISCFEPNITPSCSNHTCTAFIDGPWDNALNPEELIEDVISLYSQMQNGKFVNTKFHNFPFACSDKRPLKGLSRYTKGILTLARRPVSLHAQISSVFRVPNKFALCLPSSSASTSGYNGAIYFGGGPYHLPSTSPLDLSRSLVTTSLVVNGDSIEYFVQVKSIKVDGVPVRFNSSLLSFYNFGLGGTKLSLLDPYTVLHTEIYRALINVFVSKATTMNITRVASVGPFGACFSTKTISNTRAGPTLPIIDLILEGRSTVLHNKNARWRIYGANSIVKVSNNVSCLGFVEADFLTSPSIVIGGKQMENNLIEFDLENSKVGMTSSLLRLGTSCSQFKGI